MRRFVTHAFHHLQSHTMTLIVHVKPNTSSKVLHSRTRLLPQVKYCNNHKWPPAFGKSIVAAEGKQRRRSRAARRPWVENCESNRNTVRLAEMASTDRAPLVSLPQHFDAALLAKFYRSMCATPRLRLISSSCAPLKIRAIVTSAAFSPGSWMTACLFGSLAASTGRDPAPSLQAQNHKPVCVF